ncbi:MAG: SLBB domain-containing protein [Candidatus Latescibacterota bacterium]|nr:MAG: SLBB domain-containing protein [Candidatus Latescibacterota bacterium]
MKKCLISTLMLVCVLGSLPSDLFAQQRRLSLERRTLSDRTGSKEEPLEAELQEAQFLYEVPTSLEGPVDPDTYILGPSDELLLILRGPETATHQLRVLPEGNIILPNVGVFPVTDMTLTDCREKVKAVLKRFYRNIDIDIQLVKPRRFVVFVVGEVAKPGAVELTAPSRVSHAIAAAGGVAERGSTREIEVRENGIAVETVDLFQFLRNGDAEHNPFIKEGQNLYVPPRRLGVRIVGEVRKPQSYEILAGETAEHLIRFAGGFASTADSLHLLLERIHPGDELVTLTFSAKTAADLELMDMDVVVVPDLVSLSMGEPVEVLGGGGRDGAFQIRETETLREFLRRLWRFGYRYDIDSAVIERYVDEDTPEYIPFDARDVLAGHPVGDTVLKRGDTISFPAREKQVFVTGEVMASGAFQFQPGMTAERYIALAGGPTNSGTYNRVDIFGEDGKIRKGNRHSLVYRGETIVVKTKMSKTSAAVFTGATSLTALVLSVIAVTK